LANQRTAIIRSPWVRCALTGAGGPGLMATVWCQSRRILDCSQDLQRLRRGEGHCRAIVKMLNADDIKGRRRIRGGWSPATVSRLLRNQKYIGRWVWNRTETRRDPRTGRLRKFPKPEAEWHVVEDDLLRIVPQDVWDRVMARWKEIERTWPRRSGKRGFEGRQRSSVETHPPHLLSGSLRRGVCGGAIGQVSGKGTGYYGCLGAAKRACGNRLLVSRGLTERKILDSVRQRCLTPAAIREVLENVEGEVRRLHAHVPEEIKLMRAALADEELRIANFVGSSVTARARPDPPHAGHAATWPPILPSRNRPAGPGADLGPEGGSNSLSWWRRWELNPRPRTLSRRRLRR
jgi:hypothetical protein